MAFQPTTKPTLTMWFCFGLLPLLLLSATGCSSKSYTVRVLAVDASASTDKPAVRHVYTTSMQTIINSASGGDILAGYPITNNSQATAFQTFTVERPAYNAVTVNEDQYKQQLAAADATATTSCQHLLNYHCAADGTDLLYAFGQAASLLNGDQYRDAKRKELFVLTDGFQQANGIDFLREDLTPRRTSDLIARLKASGDLPNLKGVTVWMVGPGADPHGQISPDKLGQIRRFWLAYFKATGAKLSPSRYGACLENYVKVSP